MTTDQTRPDDEVRFRGEELAVLRAIVTESLRAGALHGDVPALAGVIEKLGIPREIVEAPGLRSPRRPNLG